MVSEVEGFALLGLRGALLIGLTYYVYRRQGVTDTREFTGAGGRAQVGLATGSFAGTWMWAGDVLGVPQCVGITSAPGIRTCAGPAALSSFVVIPFARRMRKLLAQGLTRGESRSSGRSWRLGTSRPRSWPAW